MFPERSGSAAEPPSDSGSRVWACVVCFRAHAADVRPLVATLEPQVERVLLLDNCPAFAGGLATLASDRTAYIPMPSNVGTAGAMNEAWRQASDAGAGYMISFDQDSHPDGVLVKGLLASLIRLTTAGLRVAAIGPRKVDPRTGQPMRMLRPVRYLRRYAPQDAAELVQVDHVISSGCLIPIEAFRQVGPYNEGLFLDYVDIEWCLRARARGYAIVCDPRLSMPHVIGDSVVRIGSRSVWVHQPKRNGLLVRNHLLLWRVPALHSLWLLSDLRMVLIKVLVQLCVAPPRRERLVCVLRGVRDGLGGKSGPM